MAPSFSRRFLPVALLAVVLAASVAAQTEPRPSLEPTIEPDGQVAGLIPEPTVGADLVVVSLPNVANYGREFDHQTGRWISAFGVGTTSCNRGDTPAVWVSDTNQHPVRARNLYRLHNGRFEQLGMSWLEHAFFAVRGNQCGECIDPGGVTGATLGVNCSTPTSASIAGTQHNLGPRSAVNAFTGHFPYPFNRSHKGDKIDRRLQVFTDDLDPELNPGALYFVEGHYVTPDDAAAGNHFNNASYRPVIVSRPSPQNNFCNNSSLDPNFDFCLFTDSFTREAQPAIKAWKENDPSVVETEVRIPGEGLFILAANATPLENGHWSYDYALYNMNSHRSAGGFAVPVNKGTQVRGVGFHAPFYHSGEPYDDEPWVAKNRAGRLVWHTTPFGQNPDANALRWGTLYNFRFESNAPPEATVVEIELFRPGEPQSVFAETIGPQLRPLQQRPNKRSNK